MHLSGPRLSAAHPASRATTGSTASPVTLLEPTIVDCKGEASSTSALLKEAIGMIKIAVKRRGVLEVIEVYKPCRRRQLGMELSSRPEWSYPKVSSILRNSLASEASLMVDDEVISISCTCEDPMPDEETIHTPPASLPRERLPSPNEYFAGQGSLSKTGTERQLVSSAVLAAEAGEVQPCKPQTTEDVTLSESTYV